MKLIVIAAVATAAIASAGMADAQDARQGAVTSIPAPMDTKKMGPSFKDIAAKYKGKADAEANAGGDPLSAAKDLPRSRLPATT